MGVALNAAASLGGELGGDGLATAVMDAFRNGDDAAPEALVHSFDVFEKTVDVKGAFGQIDQVRPVIGVFSAIGAGSGEESGVAAHDHADIDTGNGGQIEIDPGKGRGHIARR